MKKLLALYLIFSFSLTVFGQKPLTIDDMMKMGRLSTFAVSPDGKTAVVTVGWVNIDGNRVINDLYQVTLSTGDMKRLTEGKGSNSRPTFSLDGKHLFFVSSRSGSPQIHQMTVASGEVTQLTNYPLGVGGFILSRNNKQLLFDADGYPDCETLDCNKDRSERVENSKVKASIFENLPFRVWNYWKEGKRSQVWLFDMESKSYRLMTPGDFDTPPIDLGGDQDYTFSVDGKLVYFTRNPDKTVAFTTNNDVFQVDITGKNMVNISVENKANDNYPMPSPDGKYLAYHAMKRPVFEADKTNILVKNLATGQVVNVTENLDRSAGQMQWTSDSKWIYFTAVDMGYNTLWRVSPSNPKPEKIIDKQFIHHFELSGDQIIYSASKSTLPTELFRFDLKKKVSAQITRINQIELAKIGMIEPEEIWYEGAGGRKIHAFVYYPHNFDKTKKYPLIYLVHGGPQSAFGNSWSTRWNPQVWAANGYILVTPNPTGSTGYGQQLTDDISKDWGGKIFIDLMKGLDYSIQQIPQIDERKMAAAGASYGGYMMNWFQGHTDRFKTFVSHAGVYNLTSMFGATEETWFPLWEFGGTPWENPEQYKKWSPDQYVKNFKTPTLIIHGALDFRVPENQGFEYFTHLKYMGIDTKLLYFPDEGHWILKPQNSILWHQTIFQWLKEKL